MGKCPKCNSALRTEIKICPNCGCVLAVGERKSGSDTLNPGDHFNLDSSSDEVSPAPLSERKAAGSIASNSDAEATHVNAQDMAGVRSDNVSQSAGNDTLDPAMGLTPDPKQIEATTRELAAQSPQDPTAKTSYLSASTPASSTGMPGQANSVQGDDVGTVVNPLDRAGAGKNTAVYSENDLRDALEGKTSGTSGKLKRLWGVAAGSSDNPLHTLRGEEALASDSLFKRVALRKLAPANAPNDQEADYVIVDKVGEGGMGLVYSARQTNVSRIVALKAIKSEFQSSDESRRKFFYEAQMTAELDHPNIVPIYELGATEDGVLFYAMKLITGTEWEEVIATNTREQNLEILAKINDAVAFAHSKGIVHRDLKPANTMIGPYGEVYVTDWGMAFKTKPNARIAPGGTPAYMAPEMALHQIDRIGPVSDIYILGALLFRIITGKTPHSGVGVNEMIRAAAKNVIVNHKSEDALLPIALKAMATDLEDRYQSVEEFQAALRESRQHSDSIVRAKRSEELLKLAIESKDYELFARSVFGYREAVELWPDNEQAINGQRKAQLAHGECAVAKGDFDLAMQVVDRQWPEQEKVYQQAVKGKQVLVEREKRVTNLRKMVAAVVLAGIGVASSLAVFAWSKKNLAEKNEGIAKQATDELKKTNGELTRTSNALEGKNIALDKTIADLKIKSDALVKSYADLETKNLDLNNATDKIKMQYGAIERQRLDLVNTNANLEIQTKNAIRARDDFQKAAAQIKLEEFKSALPLAKSQLETFDVKAARSSLDESKVLAAAVFSTQQPKTDTWPWQRVNLLSNTDLPQAALGSGATAADYAPAVNLGVVGTKAGQLYLLSYIDGKLSVVDKHIENGAIEAVAISPKGDEVVFNVRQGNGNAFRVWSVSAKGAEGPPKPVDAAAAYSLQTFSYSQDGGYMVAGINKGIWLWKRIDKWYERKADNQYENIRGRLNSISLIDSSHVLVASQVNGDPTEPLTLYSVDLQDQKSGSTVSLPKDLTADISAVNYDQVNQQVVLGTSLGKLLTAKLTLGSAASSSGTQNRFFIPSADKLPGMQLVDIKEILPTKHRTAVDHIVTAGDGQMVTSGAEPVVHVWRRDSAVGWSYDTYLTGTASNLAEAVFVGKGAVLGIDTSGQSIVWDVQRQKQRQRLERLQSDGLNYEPKDASPTVGLFTTSDGQALSVSSTGMIERWDVSTGKTLGFDGQRWVYAGHTPGAEFVDVAVDEDAGIVATAANLRNVNPLYLQPTDGQWEFCIWNQTKGTMLRRWRSTAEPDASQSTVSTLGSDSKNGGAKLEDLAKQKGAIEQRLSLVDNGRALILASDKQTRIFSLDGKQLFLANDFGTYFATPNPHAVNELMLVMRSGAVALLDLKKLNSWSSAPRELALTPVNDTPQHGVWSPDGKNFYMTFISGAVASFNWDGSKLELEWSSHKLDGQKDTFELEQTLSKDATRVKTHADIDMIARHDGSKRTLYIARRVRGVPGVTDLTVLDFGKPGEPKLVERTAKKGLCWLDDSGKEPDLNAQLHSKLRIDAKRVSARSRIKDQIYITTNTASVFRLSEDSSQIASFGREKLLSVTGSRNAELLVALFADGSLKRYELSDPNTPWKPCGFAAPGCTQVALSPDGTQLAMVGADGQPFVRIVQTDSGAEVMRLAGAVAMAWDPNANSDGAIAYADGKLETFTGQARKQVEVPALLKDAQIVGLHFFLEKWSDPSEPVLKHLVIHTETIDAGQVQFVPLQQVAPNADEQNAGPAKVRSFDELVRLDKGIRLSVSPTEGVLVSGDHVGSVKLWFASPTWDPKPKELYELEGHRGAVIELAVFSQDGTTLFSADSKNRVYGWLSKDTTSTSAR